MNINNGYTRNTTARPFSTVSQKTLMPSSHTIAV